MAKIHFASIKSVLEKKIFWPDGYFACSIGEVSSATIQKYIESQG
ncbi:transposase [Sharpea porci]|nr:transposase [Sharpea porci]MDY5279096.1 transposase [Sharpea porci]